jgi:anti-sigma factor RsiW
MNCEQTTERVYDRLQGAADSNDQAELEQHLTSCPACREEAAYIERLWGEIGELNEDAPSERMRSRFYAALHAYEQETRGGFLAGLRRGLEQLWPQRPALQFAYSAGALVVGLLVGLLAFPSSSSDIEQLRAEMQSLEQTVSLSLLQHQSASQRLRGVEWSLRSDPDDRVVTALLDAVTRDPNVNVRLAAVDALAPLLDRPRVGGELVNAMEQQSSPMLQVSLAEMLLDAQVEGSRPAVERMLASEALDPTAEEHLRDVMARTS